MANQVEVPKIVQYILTGPAVNSVAVPKLVMYVWAVPGDSADTSNRQGHVHTQIITRGS